MCTNSNPLRLATLPLYGILVTERSSLLNRRGLAKSHYADFLAHRVLSSHLPTELIDQVARDLVELDCEEMLQLWRTLTRRQHYRETKFQLPTVGGTVAESAAVNELAELNGGAICDKIVVGRTDGADRRYVHISASKTRPSIAQLVPGLASNTGPALRYADGHLEVECHPGTVTDTARERVQIWPSSDKKQVGRLVQVDGIKDVIKNWDQQAVERYVKFLGLRVVSLNDEEGEELTPRLRLLQTVEWT